ncbi:MAG: hypothetical protein MOGMAGMI_01254 [Candidatus Omnitrophica bacterium]|nr:hypothetical protein [Candidatus Omnitrophota bacterium]
MKDFFSRLTVVDYLLFAAIARGVYVGYRSGLIQELMRVLTYLAAAVVALRFNAEVAQYITMNSFLNLPSAKIVAAAALVGGGFLVARLVSIGILRMMKAGEGGPAVRTAGALIGACRWVLLVSIAFMLVERSPLTPLKTDISNRSLTGPYVSQVAPTVYEYLSTVTPQAVATP